MEVFQNTRGRGLTVSVGNWLDVCYWWISHLRNSLHTEILHNFYKIHSKKCWVVWNL